jgi:DUF4097 and DUF4098 domain-containing protein YvlB
MLEAIRWSRAAVIAVACGVLLSAAAQARRIHETAYEFRYEGVVTAGRTVEVRGVNGNVTAEPSASGQVEVIAHKSGDLSDPADVRVQVTEDESGTRVCVLYPEVDRFSDSGASDVQVDITVRVPDGVKFVGRTGNGSVAATQIVSGVEAHTVNGHIQIADSGPSAATTVNGSIKVSLAAPAVRAKSRYSTVNGDVEVGLPQKARARVKARTRNGAIEIYAGRSLRASSHDTWEADVGGGGPELNIESVNGTVRLRERP